MATIKFTIQMNCGIRFDEDDAIFVSVCPTLGVYSQGETEDEALAAIKSAVHLHLSTAFDYDRLDKILRKAGFNQMDAGAESPAQAGLFESAEFVHIQVSHEYKPVSIEVPITLLAARNQPLRMPALVKPTPAELKDILLLDGWRVHREDLYNWAMVRGDNFLVIPKRGKNVTFEVLYHALEVAEMPPGRYLHLRQQVITAQRSADSHADGQSRERLQ